eukprot:2588573-Ditylum_brightwellii.AAC.1
MQKAEECLGVVIKQFHSRKFKSANLHALNTGLFYDCVLLKRTPTTSLFVNLVSNYDLVAHNIASLALQRVGMPKAPILSIFKTLQDMKQAFRTVCSDSLQE